MGREEYKVKIYRIATDIYDLYEMVDDEKRSIVSDFFSESRVDGSMMSWSVVPFARLKKIWQDYIKYNVVHDQRGLDSILNRILRNIARLQASTDLAGHSQGGSLEEFLGDEEEEFELDDDKQFDFYESFLNTEYGVPISDYGLKPLWDLAFKAIETNSSEEKLVLIDRILNVIHQRGDLAALFIEGGSGSLSELSK